jgi:hypothetical protein
LDTKGNNQLRVIGIFRKRHRQLIPLQTRRKIVMTKNSSDQHSKSSGRERKEKKEKKATQSQKERVQWKRKRKER